MSGRDFNTETHDVDERQYAYDFDFDVMHKFMMQSFAPHFVAGSALELGCFEGAFTRRLLEVFDSVTAVEASSDAARLVRENLGGRAEVIEGMFEDVALPQVYDNIVMTHVLEHVDDRVAVLKRIHNEWLSDNGRFFLVCPNANAASRQIAVKMGLISHNAGVTEGEYEHGHRITYSLDTLERDVLAAGFRVRSREGIFFKALANFQFDQAIQQGIVSPEYLDGCYRLGQLYPDLCASIFVLCEKVS